MLLNNLLEGNNVNRHAFVQADCIKWLNQSGNSETFDIVFVDPPSFSNSKRMTDVFDVQRDHVSVLRQSMRYLAKGGVLYFSNNLRGFKLDDCLQDEFVVSDMTAESIPFDFQQRKHIHRCWTLRHASAS
jgi:23S rRNA (guanine2445-N2)-methyltransferase / 23S rRNA (guanine2069-N7)-methyltransferase